MATRYYDYIAHNARRYPWKIAIVDLESDKSLTYSQLADRITALAGYLQDELGVERGARIAVLSLNRVEYFELLFACGRLGAVLVPLNWRLTVEELVGILDDAEPALLFHDETFRDAASELYGRAVPLAELELGSGEYQRVVQSHPHHSLAAELFHDDTQIIMYTSGTTGFPKGALLTYGMAFWNAVNLGIPNQISPVTCTLTVMPMFHTAGLNVYALPTLHAGGKVLVARAFDAGRVLAILNDASFGVTHFFGVPSAWQLMSQHERFGITDFSRIVLAGAGGAPVPISLLEAWQARGVFVQNGFGMTETSPSVTTLATADAIRKVGSVGKPLLHTEIRLVKDDGTDAAVGEAGELWIRGPNVTPGYWRNDAANRQSFCDGWFRSGDVGQYDTEGFLFILDRLKDMYISGGENVYPAEVENVLLQIDGVVASAVIGVPDSRWGETGLAVICTRPGVELTREAIVAHCRARLARFKQPRDVVFVDSLPLTASGKIHKPSLRARFGSAVRND